MKRERLYLIGQIGLIVSGGAAVLVLLFLLLDRTLYLFDHRPTLLLLSLLLAYLSVMLMEAAEREKWKMSAAEKLALAVFLLLWFFRRVLLIT